MPVLITPGAFTRPSSFARLAERLGAHVVTRPERRIAQFELGGLRSIGATVEAAIQDLPDDGTPLVLVGHSMGALLSLRAGLTHRIDGQVLLMPAPPDGLGSYLAGLVVRDPIRALKFAALSLSTLPVRAGFVVPPRGLYTTDASSRVIDDARVHRADESWSAVLQLLVGTRAPLDAVHVPTLVIGGTQDGLVPPDRVRRVAEQLRADYLEFDVAHNFSEEPAGIVVELAVEHWLREQALLSQRPDGTTPDNFALTLGSSASLHPSPKSPGAT